MTVKVLEHNGIYSAHRRIIKRSDDGQLYESIKRIDLPFPPIDESLWPVWAVSLNHDELDVGLQLFFDKWNFGNGTNGEGKVYQCLCDERERRKADDIDSIISVNPKGKTSFKNDPDTGMYMTSKSKLTFAASGTTKIQGKK